MKRMYKLALGTGAALGLMVAINDRLSKGVGPTPRSVDGEQHFYQWREGAIYYEVAGPRDAPPLLLVHGFNAAASSFELRRIFHLLAEDFRVYLPDLLGFGRSERPAIDYTSDLYVDLWCDFARDVPNRRPLHVVASSLSSAHLVAAAARHPERFGGLVLVCPTGVQSLVGRPGLRGALARGILRSPIVGTTLFNLLVARRSLAYYLRQRGIYADPRSVTETMLDHYYIVSHQPGARWAPAAFVSAYLNRDVSQELVSLPNPVHLVWGRRAGLTPVERAEPFLALRPDISLDVFDAAGLLVPDEQPSAFAALVRRVFHAT